MLSQLVPAVVTVELRVMLLAPDKSAIIKREIPLHVPDKRVVPLLANAAFVAPCARTA